MNLTTFEEVLNNFYGKVGTPQRDEHEKKAEEALQAYQIGDAIKAARMKQH